MVVNAAILATPAMILWIVKKFTIWLNKEHENSNMIYTNILILVSKCSSFTNSCSDFTYHIQNGHYANC